MITMESFFIEKVQIWQTEATAVELYAVMSLLQLWFPLKYSGIQPDHGLQGFRYDTGVHGPILLWFLVFKVGRGRII